MRLPRETIDAIATDPEEDFDPLANMDYSHDGDDIVVVSHSLLSATEALEWAKQKVRETGEAITVNGITILPDKPSDYSGCVWAVITILAIIIMLCIGRWLGY